MVRTHSRGAHAGKPAPKAGSRGTAGGEDTNGARGTPTRGTRARGARAGRAGEAARLGRVGKRGVGDIRVGGVRPRLSRKRVVAAAGATALLLIGLALGWVTPEPTAEPTVQSFLLDWENGQYAAAAGLTTGAPAGVAAALQDAYQDVGAADLSLAMSTVRQQGNKASASFDASVVLGRGGESWNYRGSFGLSRVGSGWKVVWSPSVIAPGLRPGLRLAVVSSEPQRAQLLDAEGKPLAPLSTVYTVGVVPDTLRNPGRTADGLARATGLSASQMVGWITEAPGASYLELVRLTPARYHRLHASLARVPGLRIEQQRQRLFGSIASAVSGRVGSEAAGVLQEDGIPYRPGTTVGLSGLQAAFQRTLVGMPTTEVVTENAAGHVVSVLRTWSGHDGTDVRTTINGSVQQAANKALQSVGDSAAIVAISPTTGHVLAVASHGAPGMPVIEPLSGKYQPGQAFTIISTAALLNTGQVGVNTAIPCSSSNPVGGENFTNDPPVPKQDKFQGDFANACSTAFAGLSLRMSGKDLKVTAAGFGLGKPWQLPLSAFAGTMRSPSNQAELAEDTIGTGSVEVSPLDMAIAAAVVQSGTWHPPSLVTDPPDPGLTPTVPFGPRVVSALQTLMRSTVTSGAGQAANVGNAPVYGQVGSTQYGSTGLRETWFVGFEGNVAFAVLELTRSAGTSAAPLAGQFLDGLQPRS
jgi:cell division protein FtsI/penicillin-binding protein 2